MLCSSLVPRTTFRKAVKKIILPILALIMGKKKIAVYIVGNAFKNFEYKGQDQSQWMRDRVKLCEKFYLLSTNFGPYYDNRWVDDFYTLFSNMEDVCFRDAESYKLFSSLKNVRYAPDAILSIGKLNFRTDENKKTIIISIIDCSFNDRDVWIKKVADTYEKRMSEIADYYISKGFRVILLNSNTKQDAIATRRIINMSTFGDKMQVLDYEGDLEIVFELYKNAEKVIATRLHTIILAWLFGVPVFPIVYDIKVNNVLKACEFSGDYIGIENINMLSNEEIEESLNIYNYELPEKIIDMSLKQFSKLDKELLDDDI